MEFCGLWELAIGYGSELRRNKDTKILGVLP